MISVESLGGAALSLGVGLVWIFFFKIRKNNNWTKFPPNISFILLHTKKWLSPGCKALKIGRSRHRNRNISLVVES